MRSVIDATRDWLRALWQTWDRFWFTPALPHTLALIRILGGSMLFYTHLVWSLDLPGFLGPHSWVSHELIRDMHQRSMAWSYLWFIESPAVLWTVHIAALVVFAALTLGLFTRVAAILAAIITLSYCHRLTGALFGLDQVNAMLAMYLAVGPAGAVWSLDRWLAMRRQPKNQLEPPPSTVGAKIAVRLIQLHMSVIYLFGGIGKMRGELWWDGSATWYAIANYEYQSWDVTWLVQYPFILAWATHVTVFWETFYPFLVWPRLTRPIALGLAVLVHGGIALFLGMPTFGIAMIIGNMAFLSPEFVARIPGLVRPGHRAENIAPTSGGKPARTASAKSAVGR